MILGRKKRESEARDRIVAFKKSFGGPDGKMVLFYLMNSYHILNAHKGDAYSEGQRSVVLDILSKCKVDVAQYDELLKGESNEFIDRDE